MIVFEILVPGTWLDHEDHSWSWKIEGQLRSLQSHFFEANLALNLFVQAQQAGPSGRSSEQWESDSRRRLEIQQEILAERGGHVSFRDREQISFEADVRFKRQQWVAGRMPREFEDNSAFLYARAFLYALDGFDRLLEVLSKTDGVPGVITGLHEQVAKAFPHLREVRNSAHHQEDRQRLLGSRGKPIVLQPIDNVIARSVDGVLVLNALIGSKYGSTMADGHYGEVDVTPASLASLQGILHGVLQAFAWKGPQQHFPSV